MLARHATVAVEIEERLGRRPNRRSSMFKPLHPDHAIESVILRLTGSGQMAEQERAILDGGHKKYWKAALPSVNRTQVMEVALGPTPAVDARQKPLAPTRYVEFMRTGKPAWWMEISGATITVGCAQYEGWKSVSQKAYGLFDGLGKTLGSAHPLAQIRSAELTYQDLFIWHGPSDAYDPKLAIREERIPKQAENSKEWHLGEGWVKGAQEERILERFQIGAELRRRGDQTRPIIQIVTTATWGFGATNATLRLDRAFGNIHSVDRGASDGRAVYNKLHTRTHALFGTLVTEEVAERIGLRQLKQATNPQPAKPTSLQS